MDALTRARTRGGIRGAEDRGGSSHCSSSGVSGGTARGGTAGLASSAARATGAAATAAGAAGTSSRRVGDGVPRGDLRAVVEEVPPREVAVLISLQMETVGAGEEALGGQDVISGRRSVSSNKLGEDITEGTRRGSRDRATNDSMGTTDGSGGGSASRGDPEVGATGDGDLNGGAIKEDTTLVHGRFQFQKGIKSKGQVVRRAGEQADRASDRGTGEGLAILEAVQGALQLLAIDSAADPIIKDVPENRSIEGGGAFAGGHKGGKKAEAGEILCGEFTITMKGVLKLMETGMEVGQ